MFNTQQIRATSETEKYTKALQKQKLTLGDMRKHKGIMRDVYREQLRMQRMSVQYWGTDSAGRAIADVAVPKSVPKDLDTMRQRMGMFGQMAKSAGTQMVNLGKNIQWAGRQLTVGFSYPVALFGAAAGVMAFKVEDAMAKINKVYDVSAAAQKDAVLREKELNNVRTESMKTAEHVARQYGLTVEKTLQVEQELAASGLSGKKLMSTTTEVQRISALGDIDPAMTTDMVVALQTAFRDTIKDGEDLTEVLNFMNATSNATSLSLQDIAEATPRAASGLAQLGVDAKQMTVMLVSMREAGIDAAEAANALKSFTTRLLNPAIVEKSAKVFREAGASFDLTDIVEKSGKNAYKFLELMGDAINKDGDKLTNEVKAQAVAALAGTYQFNRLFAAIGNFSTAQGEANNQTAKAKELLTENSDALALMAENSRKAMVNNPAGKFKIAWASFQKQLADMGKPFLEAATVILEFFTTLAKGFNSMDDWQKKMIMIVAATLAVAGPLIMLGGLVANLAGWFVKGIGAVGALGSRFKVFTLQEKTAEKVTEQTNTALMTQKQVMHNLAMEVQTLTAAYAAATKAAQAFALSGGARAANPNVVAAAAGLGGAINGTASGNRQIGPQLPLVTRNIPGLASASVEQRASLLRRAQLHEMRRIQQADSQITRQKAAQVKFQEKMRTSVNGTNVALGAGSVAMAAMMVSSNKTVDNISQWALIGAMVVPAVVAVAKWTKVAAAASLLYFKNMMGAAGASAGRMAMAGAGAKGLITGIAGLMGPLGWSLAAVSAIGVGMFVWQKHIEAARNKTLALHQAQDKAQAALLNSTKAWADATGEAYTNYVRYNAEGKKDANNKNAMARQEIVDFYKKQTVSSTVGGQTKKVKVSDQWDDLTGNQRDYNLDFKTTELLGMGKSVDEVRTHLEAFLIATGESLGTSSVMIDSALSRVGETAEDIDWMGMARRGFAAWEQAADNPELRKSISNSLGNTMSTAIDSMKTPEDKKAYMDYFKANFAGAWDDARGDLENILGGKNGLESLINNAINLDESGENKARTILTPLLEDAEALRTMSFEDIGKLMSTLYSIGPKKMDGNSAAENKAANEYSDTLNNLLIKLKQLKTDERETFGFAQDWFGFDESVDTMDDFFGQFKFKMEEAKTQWDKLHVFSIEKGNPISEAAKTWYKDGTIANDVIANIHTGLANLDTTKMPQWIIDFLHEIEAADPSIDFKIDADEVEKEVNKAKASLDSLPSAVNIGLNITAEQSVGVIKSAMENVQSEMSDSAMNKFNSGWDARMSGAQAGQKAAQDAFDNRWENRKDAVENYYKRREDLINKEIRAEERADTIRQRLFDAERTRLQRLAELQNQNIDFNQAVTEGRLDDAAKIGNDMVAKDAVNQMDDEQKRAEELSADRRERLEKRIEALNDRREKQLKRLDKIQERMRQHMERAQAGQIAGLERQRAAEEASLNDRLELFKSYTGRNQKDLEAWMKKVGLSYDDFGIGVQAKGESWSTHLADRLAVHIRRAGAQVSSDNMWEQVGKEMSEQLLRGMGFKDLKAFQRFVKTGNTASTVGAQFGETRHEGGVIGSGGGSRGNIPNTYKGLHRSETLVRAQKGEYMVNRNDAAKHKPLLDAINSGTDIQGGIGGGLGLTGIPSSGGPGYGGPAALLSGVIAKMFSQGVKSSYANLYNDAKSAKGKNRGQAYTGKAFDSFDAEQIQNAAIIASVGSKRGMTSRDLMIGIMTAITESGLRNINYGDRDSVGLFQQRTSQGWGTVEQIMNPRYAAGKFFDGLKGVKNRAAMSPWLAAQAVQRSFDPTGGNYKQYWDEANAIFKKGLKAATGGSAAGVAGYVPGSGGKHRPISGAVTSGLHGGSTAGNPPAVDLAGPTGRPVYAVSNGVITSSRDIAGPLGSDRYRGDGPYGSFGRMVAMRTDGGANILYAHLSRRAVAAGQRVKGGAVIGRSGNTGNSSGPHLHFGATNGPYAWLRTGGKIRHDNTPAILHKDETVLTSALTRKFQDNVAGGSDSGYSVVIDLRGAYIKEDVDIEKAVNKAIDSRENKRGRSRKVTD